ncbi:hypothetical protein ABH975_002734 [Bradyrhizobium ottawaense]
MIAALWLQLNGLPSAGSFAAWRRARCHRSDIRTTLHYHQKLLRPSPTRPSRAHGMTTTAALACDSFRAASKRQGSAWDDCCREHPLHHCFSGHQPPRRSVSCLETRRKSRLLLATRSSSSRKAEPVTRQVVEVRRANSRAFAVPLRRDRAHHRRARNASADPGDVVVIQRADRRASSVPSCSHLRRRSSRLINQSGRCQARSEES